MHMLKRAAIVAASGLLALAASGAALAEPVTIRFLTQNKVEVFKPSIDAFEKANPNIKVEFQTVPFDSLTPQIEARVGARDPGLDVFMVDSPRIPALSTKGYLLNLNEFQARAKAVTSKEAYGVLTHKNDLFALPLWTSTQMMFFNKALLDKAGIAHPGTDEKTRLTYAQIVEFGKKAQASGAKWGFMFEQITRYYQLEPLFTSIGGGTGLKGPDNMEPDVNNPKWVEASKFYASLFEQNVAPRGIPINQLAATFAAGETAFFVGGPWNIAAFDAAQNLNYGVALVPYFAGGKPSTPTDSWTIGVNPHSGHKAEAKLFAEFITLNATGNGLTTTYTPYITSNNEAFGPYIDAFATRLKPDVGPSVRKVISHELAHTSVSRPRSLGYLAFEQVLNNAFSDIRNGADPKATLDKAQAQLKSTLSRIR